MLAHPGREAMRTADIVVAAGIGVMAVLLAVGMHYIITPHGPAGPSSALTQPAGEPFP